jgi:hypothetical protein
MIWVSVIIIISGSKIDDGDDNTVGDSDNDHSDFDKDIIIINAVVMMMMMMIVQCSGRFGTSRMRVILATKLTSVRRFRYIS